MRITMSEFKKAARDRQWRRAMQDSQGGFPTPMPMAQSAVRRFHREGADASVTQLNDAIARSEYWGPNGNAPARSWAETISECFQRYIDLASLDSRPTLGTPVVADVRVGSNAIGVSLDVVLLDPNGYVGRHLLWDRPELTQSVAELLAAPIVLALEQELGMNRVVGAEVWHLRSGQQHSIDRATALAGVQRVQRVVNRYTS